MSTALPLQFSRPNMGSLKFGLVTDSHYADREPAGTRYFRQALPKMEEFIEVMNRKSVDFIIHLGDFKDQDEDKRGEDTLKYLTQLESVFQKFNGPTYHCIGNHDVDSITKSQFLEHVNNTGIPKDKSYYSFDIKGFHFIVLDANYTKDGKDHFFLEGANWQDTNLPEEERDWLRRDLSETSFPTIVFCHHPLFVYDHSVYRDYKFHVNDHENIQNILSESGKVAAVFQGHVHEESYRDINGIQYITQLGLVDYEGLDNNSFSIVEIKKSKLKIKGFKRVSDFRSRLDLH
jgi:alkaline phosphatase